MERIRYLLLSALLLPTASFASEHQEPFLELLPSSILKQLNGDVYVSCTAKVEDPELVTEMRWVSPNGHEIPNDNDSRIITMEGIGGPGKLDLMISKLEEKDAGIYNCTAIYAGNQNLTADISVDYFMDINFGDTPTHEALLNNSEGKIRCIPTAKPAPQVDWLKDGIPLKEDDDDHVIHEDGVLIKRVTEADEGVYRCRARVPQINSIEYIDIQVEVYILPSITIVPMDVTGAEEETVQFRCGAIGKPPPVYSWVNNKNESLEDGDGYFVDAETGMLTIIELKSEKAGTYRCAAKNPFGEDTAEANLMVVTKP